MKNFNENQDIGGINAAVLNVASATPLYLFLACIGSFIILLVVQVVHDTEFWTAKMPTIGIFLGIVGPLFIQVVRFGGLIGSTFNFSRKNLFAGVLCIALSVATSLWEHNHVPGMAAYFLTADNAFLAKDQFISFLRILIWIGLGLELLIVASTYGKSGPKPDFIDSFKNEMDIMREQLSDTNHELLLSRKEAAKAIAELQKMKPLELDPLLNGSDTKH